jgi:hypothetical protein
MITIEKWKLWAFLCYTVYLLISMYGTGINRVKADLAPVIIAQERVIEGQKFLIDTLLIESGRDTMYNTEQELDVKWEQWQNRELFRKENQLDG